MTVLPQFQDLHLQVIAAVYLAFKCPVCPAEHAPEGRSLGMVLPATFFTFALVGVPGGEVATAQLRRGTGFWFVPTPNTPQPPPPPHPRFRLYALQWRPPVYGPDTGS